MRPVPGNNTAAGRSLDDMDASLSIQMPRAQTSYVLTDGDSIDSVNFPINAESHQRPRDLQRMSPHGVPELKRRPSKADLPTLCGDHPPSHQQNVDAGIPDFEASMVDVASALDHISLSNYVLSQAPTPGLTTNSAGVSQLPSPLLHRSPSLGSFSDMELNEEARLLDQEQESAMLITQSEAMSQLVIPSISMPTRRPFTPRGRKMGRSKLLIAGASGVGKTSLLKAIVQTCEDIVHVDPIATTLPPNTQQSCKDPNVQRRRVTNSQSTKNIMEISASTRPYPEWWLGLDENSAPRRRRSEDDAVLDRNICFVDTPGHGNDLSRVDSVIRYIEWQFHKLTNNTLSDLELLTLVSGDGGCQIDAVLYLVVNDLSSIDLAYLHRLSPLTNVIVLLAQSDQLSKMAVDTQKSQIMDQLEKAGIRSMKLSQPAGFPELEQPIAISGISEAGRADLDASLLMSPDYAHPLEASELPALIELLFEPDTMSRLRYNSAQKYLQWRATLGSSRAADQVNDQNKLNALIPKLKSALQTWNSQSNLSGGRKKSIRIAKWAAQLRKSLAIEQNQYEAASHDTQVGWITTAAGGGLDLAAAMAPASERNQLVKFGKPPPVGRPRTFSNDPLGLLELVGTLRSTGLLALRFIGGMCLTGGAAFLLLSKSGLRFVDCRPT